jgi:hypothetical protein
MNINLNRPRRRAVLRFFVGCSASHQSALPRDAQRRHCALLPETTWLFVVAVGLDNEVVYTDLAVVL